MKTRCTVAQATSWAMDEVGVETESMLMGDLDFTPAQARAGAGAWVYLLGAVVPDDVAEARDEALSDPELFVCLHRPLTEFLHWFRVQDWSFFGREYDVSHAWAWAVLDRCRAFAATLGPALACQVSVVEAVRRATA